MRRECPNASPECHYWDKTPPPELRGSQSHGCYEDKDHLIPRRAGFCAVTRYIIKRPENQEYICRKEHDLKNHREMVTGIDDHPLPSLDEIAEIIADDIEAGRHIPTRVTKELNRLLEQREVERYWHGRES